MSGIEAAGLALTILPLMVSALQHYEDCFRPFLRYKRFAKEADVFRKLFSVQKAIFRNQCAILLQELVEHDAALAILNGARHLSDFDDDLERRLNELLGESKEPCVAIMNAIHDKLSDMESESQQLEITIQQERQVHQDSYPSKHKAWRTRVANKLRFSFGKSSQLNQNLTALRIMNSDFVTLSQQMTKSSISQRRDPQSAAQITPMELQRYQTIGQASCRVYEALSKACTKHTEHQALIRVEVEQELVHGNYGSRFKFDMAFTSPKSSSSAQQDDLLWFVINSTVGDEDTDPSVEDASKEDLVQSLKRQIEPSEGVAAKKQKKRVRFNASTPAPPPVPILASISTFSGLDSFDSMGRDLCDYLRRHIRRPVSEGVWPCVLENRGKCKNILYPSSTSSCMRLRQATSLGDLISSVVEQKSNGRIPLFERVRLAKVLAIAVLQYHATPWLATSWRSENIYLIASENPSSSQPVHDLSSPYFNVRIKDSNEQLPQVSASSPYELARNALLFSLAVVLLEIAHSARLETMYRPLHQLDHMNGEENPYTQFFTARRLAKSDYSNLGPRYHKIVERLLECDFACGDDLGSRELQAAVHNEVVCPLEQLEQGLRKLYLGT